MHRLRNKNKNTLQIAFFSPKANQTPLNTKVKILTRRHRCLFYAHQYHLNHLFEQP